ncbi:hypothetical protein CDO52_16990 [Nocardiopsis gilva YIM 90087]|uniref:DUF7482 domain-containing protein n=1 Tax=Nocardiopsis gilva YIM 90087 TaxID=1235441 RepID=A0A223S817_9ACTN|nr:hypothetical protein [Nocardiopsis gilva]ASU84265.1 hypothetical protein CDO52_16990 [Nocardiopsis gilva YIM 90087]
MSTPTSGTEHDDHSADRPRTPWSWWTPWLTALVAAALVIGGGSYAIYGLGAVPASMSGAMHEGMPPPVTGYYADEPIRFLHTEASDAEVADLLTDMMDSPVVHVPALADTPDPLHGPVYVFINGIEPDGAAGPFGFQPDVFASVPGDDAYTPLRSVHLVEWRPSAEPRTLTSADAVAAAERAGEVAITEPGIVVTMPVVDWPDGQR